MRPVHEGLPYRSFTYPYLGPNTGVFGITDADLVLPTNPSSSVFSDYNTVQFPGLTITGDYQPEIYVAPDTSSPGGIFSDNGTYSGNQTQNDWFGNNIVIFG